MDAETRVEMAGRRKRSLLQWSRARMDAETRRRTATTTWPWRFNGAAPVWTRRPARSLLVYTSQKLLQWGRARVDAETPSA